MDILDIFANELFRMSLLNVLHSSKFKKKSKIGLQINNAAEIGIVIHDTEFRAGGGFVSISFCII